jgi:hypothetical protein
VVVKRLEEDWKGMVWYAINLEVDILAVVTDVFVVAVLEGRFVVLDSLAEDDIDVTGLLVVVDFRVATVDLVREVIIPRVEVEVLLAFPEVVEDPFVEDLAVVADLTIDVVALVEGVEFAFVVVEVPTFLVVVEALAKVVVSGLEVVDDRTNFEVVALAVAVVEALDFVVLVAFLDVVDGFTEVDADVLVDVRTNFEVEPLTAVVVETLDFVVSGDLTEVVVDLLNVVDNLAEVMEPLRDEVVDIFDAVVWDLLGLMDVVVVEVLDVIVGLMDDEVVERFPDEVTEFLYVVLVALALPVVVVDTLIEDDLVVVFTKDDMLDEPLIVVFAALEVVAMVAGDAALVVVKVVDALIDDDFVVILADEVLLVFLLDVVFIVADDGFDRVVVTALLDNVDEDFTAVKALSVGLADVIAPPFVDVEETDWDVVVDDFKVHVVVGLKDVAVDVFVTVPDGFVDVVVVSGLLKPIVTRVVVTDVDFDEVVLTPGFLLEAAVDVTLLVLLVDAFDTVVLPAGLLDVVEVTL